MTTPYLPRFNDKVECLYHTLMVMSISKGSLIKQKDLLAKAVKVARFMSNGPATISNIEDCTPYEETSSHKSTVIYFRAFGCRVYMFQLHQRRGDEIEGLVEEGGMVEYCKNAYMV